jgi:FkbM family methyltransferase
LIVEEAKLVYDVGMHRGEDADFYLNKGFRVIGFEANPQLIENCKIRFQDAIATGQLHIVEGAIAPPHLGNKVTFFQNLTHSIWGTIDSNWADRNAKLGCESRAITVDRVDIVECFKGFGIPYYLKIDVEGADKLVLEGLKSVDARPKFISLESEKIDFSALRAELFFLRELGYSKFNAVQQEGISGRTIVAMTLGGREFRYTFGTDSSGPFGNEILQPWLTFEDVLQEYESIFHRYRLFGDSSLYGKLPLRMRRYIGKLYKLGTGHAGLPGWYDTHASL